MSGLADYLVCTPSVQALLRICYSLLLLGTLLSFVPAAHRFFATERERGYIDSSPWLDRLLSPRGRVLVLLTWMVSALWLLLGRAPVLTSLVCLAFCRFFFVSMRWSGIARGHGAPGFMLYWLGALVAFLEYTSAHAPEGWLRPLGILAFKVDFAVIFLCAGLYKLLSGYPSNNGMERGMVNPFWGHWWSHYRRLPPDHVLFRALNHLAYLTELVTAVMCLIPPVAEAGALILAATFAFIAVNIRLNFLCLVVMACCLLFGTPGGWVDRAAHLLVGTPVATTGEVWNTLNLGLGAYLAFYLALLPLAKAGLYRNFYLRKRQPELLQKFQDWWCNLHGIIIWRVFTIDNTNFFVRVYLEDRDSGARTLYSRFGRWEWPSGARYLNVCEFVCITCVFTTLKYFPGDPELFARRLWRYESSIPRQHWERVVFEYVDIRKENGRFEDVVSQLFWFESGKLMRQNVADGRSSTDSLRLTDLHQGHRVGSYAPV